MPDIKTIADANAALLPYVPLVHDLLGKDSALRRIRPLMAAAGNPQNKLKIIHIAGTSGKTSTAYFMNALLTASGQKTGLTVSPHVDIVTERVQINGQPLDEATFCTLLEKFLVIVETLPEKPSYFELLYAFSFWVFAEQAVTYAVVETGMGGLFDPTNIADRPDKICVITDIGFDHMHVLGKTIEEIATQKAGIIHEHNQVIMYEQSPVVMAVVERQVTDMQADLKIIEASGDNNMLPDAYVDDLPIFQRRNWLLAFATFQIIALHDNLPSLSLEQNLATQRVQVPGRMDVRSIGNKTIVMDGAHNAQKMKTFATSFQQRYPKVKPAVLLALKESKEPVEIIPILSKLASRIIITTFETSQDLPARSQNPDELAMLFKQAGFEDVAAISDQKAAYQELLNGSEAVCIITGSFYLLSQLRALEHLT